jgi:hypothetical protein
MMGFEDWIDTYRSAGFAEVQGWLNPAVFGLLKAVARVQREFGLAGGAMEIGVHHGKFFLPLNAMVDNEAIRSIAIDVFADQHLNIDRSGLGDEANFRANLERYDRHGGRNVVVLRADATRLVPTDIELRIGAAPKVVSIDGGHTVEHTIHDLELAAAVVQPSGIVFVDDVTNHHWLGVIEGVIRFLDRRPTLWPVAIGFNKLLLSPMSVARAYMDALKPLHAFSKGVTICGYPMLAV